MAAKKRNVAAGSKNEVDGWVRHHEDYYFWLSALNPQFIFIAPSFESPPRIAYLILKESMESVCTFSENNPGIWWRGYAPAIRIRISGSTCGTDYAPGSRPTFATGVLHLPAVFRENWKLSDDVVGFWLTDLWEWSGFEKKHPDMTPYFSKTPPLNFYFKVIHDLNDALDDTQKLFLTIRLLFTYWDTMKEKGKILSDSDRARHVVQLGLKKSLSRGNLRNYCYEASCLYMPKSMFDRTWRKSKRDSARCEAIKAQLLAGKKVPGLSKLRNSLAGRIMLRDLKNSGALPQGFSVSAEGVPIFKAKAPLLG